MNQTSATTTSPMTPRTPTTTIQVQLTTAVVTTANPASTPNFSSLSRWPSVFMTLVVLIGVGIFLEQIDFQLNNSKVVMSALFGFSTSCLLLTFVWLLQRDSKEPLESTRQNSRFSLELPSLNPGGRVDRLGLPIGQRTLSTVSSPRLDLSLDQPPNYQDALLYSQPIDSILIKSTDFREKAKHFNYHHYYHHNDHHGQQRAKNSLASEHLKIEMADVDFQPKKAAFRKANSLDAHLNSNLFTASSTSSSSLHHYENPTNENRKSSLLELDVSQLLLSPPEYNDLNLLNIIHNNDNNQDRGQRHERPRSSPR